MVNIFHGTTDPTRGPIGAKGDPGPPGPTGKFPPIEVGGGGQGGPGGLGLAPLKLLWSGRQASGSLKLRNSPHQYRVVYVTAHYEEGRYWVGSFLPAAAGLEEPMWYIPVGNSNMILTFTGAEHTVVKIQDFRGIQLALSSIYGAE